MKKPLFFAALLIFPLCVFAEYETDESQQQQMLIQKTAIRDQLRAEIAQIDAEKRRCDSARNNWTAATVVGGVGVVGTGIGAIVQHNQIQDKKKTLNDLKEK
jgi:ribosomal protein S5